MVEVEVNMTTKSTFLATVFAATFVAGTFSLGTTAKAQAYGGGWGYMGPGMMGGYGPGYMMGPGYGPGYMMGPGYGRNHGYENEDGYQNGSRYRGDRLCWQETDPARGYGHYVPCRN
jgi:hypothetical protein